MAYFMAIWHNPWWRWSVPLCICMQLKPPLLPATCAHDLCQPMGSAGDSISRRNLHRPGIAKEGRSKTKPRTATINPNVQQTGPLTVGRWGVGRGVTVLSMCYGLPQMPSRLPSQVLPDGGATSGCCGQCLPRAGVMSDHFLILFS